MRDIERQSVLDEEHLRLLRIGYFIAGGFTAFVGLFGLFYIFMGVMFSSFITNMPNSPSGPPPPPMGWVFVLIGVFIVIFGAGLAILKFFTARALGLRRSYTFCLITAGFSCLNVPFGTFLGVCTFLVLARPSVRALFEAKSEAGGTPPPLPLA